MEQIQNGQLTMARSVAKTQKSEQVNIHNQDSNTLTGMQREAMRKTLMAQICIALAELRIIQAEVEFIGCALQHRLLTPHQAMQMAFNTGVLDWVFPVEDAAR